MVGQLRGKSPNNDHRQLKCQWLFHIAEAKTHRKFHDKNHDESPYKWWFSRLLRYHRVLPFIPSHEKQHPASRRCSLLPLESQCTWETNSNCHGKRRKHMAKYCILEHDDYRYLKLYKYVITPCSNNPMSVLIDTSNFNGLTDGLDGVKPQSLRIPWSYYASLYVFELRKKTNDEACNIHICMDYSNSPALKLAAAILPQS